VNLDRIRLALPLALLAVSACKDQGELDEGMNADPSTAEDAAAPADAGGGFQLPPFDITDLFPRRDAGRPQPEPVRDAGSQVPITSLRVGPQGDQLIVGEIALEVPRGAVTRATELTFSELPSPPPGASGRAWLIAPAETRFAVAARVAFQFTPEQLAIAPANEWAVATLQNGAWVPLPGQSNDLAGALVAAPTQVLGAFALVRVPPRGGDASVPDAGVEDAGAADASVDASGMDGGTLDAGATVDAGPSPFCQPGACANGTCVEGLSDFGCICNAGYTLAPDLHSCALDACLGVTCAGGKVCAQASGQCACPAGLELTPLDTCAAPGTYCLPTSCAPGTCVEAAGDFTCTCPTCYGGSKTCAEIDECAAGTAACLPGETCLNTVGAYQCICLAPNTIQNGSCVP
jgi:hypothetical protein